VLHLTSLICLVHTWSLLHLFTRGRIRGRICHCSHVVAFAFVHPHVFTLTHKPAGLQIETDRQILRASKKLTKKTLANTDPDGVTLLRARLESLDSLIIDLKSKAPLASLIAKATSLSLTDTSPIPQKRGVKEKGPRSAPKSRKPFRTYTSPDNITILVGKAASDNDTLSTTWEYRTPKDWWMHASGCAGSHVVIKCEADDLPTDEALRRTVVAAAALAARASKCAPANNVTVNLVRCGSVSKPIGAKAGLVRLSGDVRNVKINLKREEALLMELDETCQVN